MTGAEGASRRRTRALLVALSVILACVAYAYCSGGVRPAPTREEFLSEQRTTAARIRIAAQHSCEAGLSRDCLRLYDEAKRFDPGGDLDPAVQRGRAGALEAIDASRPTNGER